jgi:hypothetical protein
MSRNYKFHNPEGLYFVSSAIDYADEQGMIANLIVYRNF